MKDLSFIQLNHLAASKENDGAGSRLIAEIKHYGNRYRFTSILVNSVDTTVRFYKK
jgi:hypothetical protein